jgi:hypothetical protein
MRGPSAQRHRDARAHIGGLQAEARRQHTGWLYVIDARTPTPAREVPAYDIIGAFEVREGTVVPQSYQPNGNHRLFSSNGLFKLDSTLHEKLMNRVIKQAQHRRT